MAPSASFQLHSANRDTSGPSRYSSITTRPHAGGVVERGLAVVGHHDPLAGGQPVVLHDVRRPERVERGRGLVGGLAQPGGRGRDAGGGHHVLGERLGALEPGGLAGRPEAGDAARHDVVGHARDQRCLGADHDEVDAEPLGEGGHGGAGHRVHVVQRGDRGHARVAGGGVHLGDAGVEGQGTGQGVLAAAGADDEGLHVQQASGAPPSHVRRGRPTGDRRRVGERPVPQDRVVRAA